MQHTEIREIFEAYFEKYKKTEGDRSSWSAVWLESSPNGTLELNMTKCPAGTTFKIFVNRTKITEVIGWDAFFPAMNMVAEKHPGLYDAEKLFTDMKFVI
ncbi:hypothetical protein [Maridesulfovibrio sp.]|uniref:hypothetical protein n=1 Tax=Maridesulfovibrio sp. TaxID=2795000 RepID=UPI002A186E53|nr:hypothetical protein [Maridesulfovibrio sp.]